MGTRHSTARAAGGFYAARHRASPAPCSLDAGGERAPAQLRRRCLPPLPPVDSRTPSAEPGGHLSEIDWKQELRKIEREYDGLPPEPSAEELRARREAERRERERHDAVGAAFWVVVRLLLIVALAAGLPLWPYPGRCGAPVAAHLAAILALIVASVWTAASAWRRRMAASHVLALLILLWGLGLAAQELLPRIGYARPDPTRPPHWICS